jgi:pimeloyl-ACP methyl ester carboxylesterase
MPYQAVRGVDHYYEWITESDRPSTGPKPVMVFIHGWAGSSRYWRTTAQALTPYFDCLLYDMRGFGRSRLPQAPAPELDYALETYADDLAILLDELGQSRVYLNAHSMGASVATLFLNRHRHRIEQAVLTCSGIFDYDRRAFEAFYRFGGYVVRFRPPWLTQLPGVHRLFMARFLHRAIPSAESRSFLQDFLDADYAAAMGTIYTSVSKEATEVMPREFAQVIPRTLLISGQYDQIIPADMGQRAAALSPNVTQVVIPRTAHFPMLEDAPTYLQVLSAFLELGDRTPLPVV